MSVSLVTSLADAPMITPPAELPSPPASLLQMTDLVSAVSAVSAASAVSTSPFASPSPSPSSASASPSSAEASDDSAETSGEGGGEEDNTGTCHGPPGLAADWFATGRWPAALAQGDVACNSALNNVTRACCSGLGEARMGSECGLVVCRVPASREGELTACFEQHGVKHGCQRPLATTTTAEAKETQTESARDSGAGRTRVARSLLAAAAVALAIAL